MNRSTLSSVWDGKESVMANARCFLAAGVFFVGMGTAQAGSGMRCGTRLVDVGTSMYELREKCGEPDAVAHRIERRVVQQVVRVRRGNVEESRIESREVDVPVDEWTYDFGPTSFIRYAVFEFGRLVDVITGSYGVRASR